MKVSVDVAGFSKLSRIIGVEQMEFPFSGENINDLITELIAAFGKEAKKAFHDDEQDIFNPMIQVILNEKEWIPVYRYTDTVLKEGDTLSFVVLLAGG